MLDVGGMNLETIQKPKFFVIAGDKRFYSVCYLLHVVHITTLTVCYIHFLNIYAISLIQSFHFFLGLFKTKASIHAVPNP